MDEDRCRRHHLQDAGAGKIEDAAVAAAAAGRVRGDLGLLHSDLSRTIGLLAEDGDVAGYAVYTPRRIGRRVADIAAGGLRAGAASAMAISASACFRAPQTCSNAGHDGAILLSIPTARPCRWRSCARRSMRSSGRQCRPEPGVRWRLHADRPVEAASSAVRGHSLEHQHGVPADADRAREIGLPVVDVPPWYDVDDAASLRMLEDELAGRAPGFSRHCRRRRTRDAALPARAANVSGRSQRRESEMSIDAAAERESTGCRRHSLPQ